MASEHLFLHLFSYVNMYILLVKRRLIHGGSNVLCFQQYGITNELKKTLSVPLIKDILNYSNSNDAVLH